MIFNKALHTFLCCLTASALICGCSSNPEKDAIDTENSASTQHGGTVSSALPAGPVTPNPYLQTKPNVSSQVENNFRNATAAMQQKNWSQAETILQALATANPNLSGVHLNLGIVHRAKNDMTKAAEAFNRALAANPKNLDAYNQLALLKREAGEFSEAELLYQKALGVWRFHPETHKNIAILYELYLGKAELALPHYQAYQQLLPAPDKQVDSWVADLQRRVGGGKPPVKAAVKADVKVEATADEKSDVETEEAAAQNKEQNEAQDDEKEGAE
jgi:tetratricopeptide (TPR) repeat protein